MRNKRVNGRYAVIVHPFNLILLFFFFFFACDLRVLKKIIIAQNVGSNK